MEPDVLTCRRETSAARIASMMTNHNFGSLPVIEEDETLIGIVSEYDLLQLMVQGRDPHKITAADIMTSQIVTVTEELSLESLANLFQDRYVTRVPVVRGRRLVGIVARRDLIFGYMKALEYWS
jgi:CBS domain-containing protein